MKQPGLTGITFQQIEIFLAAAKYENFTRAAEDLYMTQASVSRNILSMELALGLVLFIRSGRGVRLTNAGKNLERDSRHILKRTEKAVDDAFLLQRNQFKSLSVGDQNCTAMDFYLMPIVSEFEKRHPDIELGIERLPPDVLIENLISGKYDAAFSINLGMDELLPNGITAEPLFELTPCAVLADSHPLYGAESLTPEQLSGLPMVSMNRGIYRYYWDFARSVALETGLDAEDVKLVDNVFTLAMELKRGRRFAIMDACFAPMNQTELRYVPLGGCRTKSGIALLFRAENDNPSLDLFRAVCREFAKTIDTRSV